MNAFWQTVSGAITIVFFAITLSNYYLLFRRKRPVRVERNYNSVTIITPAHNEERHIEACVRSALNADFDGFKEIIVVDDGSTDRTAEIVSRIDGVRLIKTSHRGKAASLNMAIQEAQGELVAILDGDTEIKRDALAEIVKAVENENVVAATCPVTVKNRDTHVLIWLHMELLFGSLMRLIMEKVNANIVTSGQFCIFRKAELMSIGGFSTVGFSEDVDVTIRLIRAGYHVGYAENAIALTNQPEDFRSLLKQRIRWVRGTLSILTRHLQFNSRLIDVYTLPLLLFNYIQAVVMGSLTIYKINDGYWTYFASKGEYFSPSVINFLFDWVSILGAAKWSFGLLTGDTPATFVNVAGVIATVLTYPLYVYAIMKFDKKFDWSHLLALTFMAPLWWTIMLVQIVCVPYVLNRNQYNIWHKNDKSWNVTPNREAIEKAQRDAVVME